MATTIITPPPSSQDSNSGMGFFLGIVVLVVFAILFVVYGLPYFRGLTSGGVQVNLPNKIDVNVQQE